MNRQPTQLTFNRTSLELKPSAPAAIGPSRLLLIEPVWNWNWVRGVNNKCFDILLIEPVWNWNVQVRKLHRIRRSRLLIEPVWNWNMTDDNLGRYLKCSFNRTSLELKPAQAHFTEMSALPFNRTSLELKHMRVMHQDSTRFPFNRTSLELKHQLSQVVIVAFKHLLIEPVWNWNTQVR